MKILITGSQGLLGSAIMRSFENDFEMLGTDLPELNIANQENVKRYLDAHPVEILINCAAYTDVPGAEKSKELAYNINAIAPGILANICKDRGIHLIHFGTEFIFDGNNGTPYIESDTPNPLNYYGATKLQGENIILEQGGSF